MTVPAIPGVTPAGSPFEDELMRACRDWPVPLLAWDELLMIPRLAARGATAEALAAAFGTEAERIVILGLLNQIGVRRGARHLPPRRPLILRAGSTHAAHTHPED